MSTRDIFLFVESNTSGTGRLFAERVRSFARPIMLVKDASRYPYIRDLDLQHRVVDTSDFSALSRAVQALSAEGVIRGVWSTSEYYIASAARLAATLGLPWTLGDYRAIERCRSKAVQRRILSQAGIIQPRSRYVRSLASLAGRWEQSGRPAVLKPTNGSGSVGVRLIRDKQDLMAYLAAAGRADDGYLMEEYIDGAQYSVELFSLTSIGVTRQRYFPPPSFIAQGHEFPATVDRRVADMLERTAVDACRALGLLNGPAHVEIRVADGKAYVIEVNPRLAGGFIPELVRLASGVDLIQETCRFACGGTPRLQPTRENCAAIRFILATRAGILQSATLPTGRELHPSVDDVQLYKRLGDRIEVFGDFRDRLGHVIASHPLPAIAILAALQAAGLVALATEDPSIASSGAREPVIRAVA